MIDIAYLFDYGNSAQSRFKKLVGMVDKEMNSKFRSFAKMKKFTNAVAQFIRDEKGTEIVEWAIVGGLVVAVGGAIFVTIGSGASTKLTALNGVVNTPTP